ncbi:MAG: Re/Si-specific NAD(P)(+) transhydrogenase subunit alpha [Trueperaceae bacterium]|nr:Re/Si-specific NAD(P)(+) transhydrogenase subunit alpha [Trueperaceae bacterium]
MAILALKETSPAETRTTLTPATAGKLVKLGATVQVETGIGERIHYADDAYREAGADIVTDRDRAIADADVVVRLSIPSVADVAKLKAGTVHVSYLDPFRNPDLVKSLADAKVSALCMELIPRSTYAQKMDALSSQASLAGYAAIILAAERLHKVLPMMSTPAGTIAPSRVFIVGVGVAGLQAIATAKRLGARVEAYDTRPAVAEQVASLGAKFVEIDVGETGETKQGYAKALTEEQLDQQRRQMARFCANADIIVTTAQLFGRPAPRIITAEMVAGMRPGSVIVDLAASTGGNVEGSKPDEEVEVNGVRIIGLANMPGRVAADASQMYASNVVNLLDHLWDKDVGGVGLEPSDTIVDSCLLTHNGDIRNQGVRDLVEAHLAKGS